MDYAVCKTSGAAVYAIDFAHLNRAERYKQSLTLVCPNCSSPAYFRKKLRQQLKPCFFSRPHKESCSPRVYVEDSVSHSSGFGSGSMARTYRRIILDVGPPIQQESRVAVSANIHARGRLGKVYGGEGEHKCSDGKWKAGWMLRSLISSQLRESATSIVLPDESEMPASIFFVPFSDATTRHCSQFRGFWGTVSSAQYNHEGTGWLNFGDWDRRICIPGKLARAVEMHLGVNHLSELNDAQVLIVGKMNQSYIQVTLSSVYSIAAVLK